MSIVEKNVEFGLEAIDVARTVELPLRDSLYAYKTLGEFVAFFHQPDNWKNIEDVKRFIGNKSEGALHVLWQAYYGRLRESWPPEIQNAFDDGLLDRNPVRD
jgi:hypothetical protein